MAFSLKNDDFDLVVAVLLFFGSPVDWVFPNLEGIFILALDLVMGCFNSKQARQPPGYEDPVVLASETACKLHDRCSTGFLRWRLLVNLDDCWIESKLKYMFPCFLSRLWWECYCMSGQLSQLNGSRINRIRASREISVPDIFFKSWHINLFFLEKYRLSELFVE